MDTTDTYVYIVVETNDHTKIVGEFSSYTAAKKLALLFPGTTIKTRETSEADSTQRFNQIELD